MGVVVHQHYYVLIRFYSQFILIFNDFGDFVYCIAVSSHQGFYANPSVWQLALFYVVALCNLISSSLATLTSNTHANFYVLLSHTFKTLHAEMPPSPVKDALAKLDWQEENARAVETVLGTWGVDPTIINVSVFKPITNSAVNQLLTAVTPGSNDPAARKIHNLLMLRRNYTNNINAFLVCNVARDMPLDASSQITLYIDGLFSLISKRVLKFQTLGQDILSLQCLESGALPGYNLTVAILIRKALDNFDMSMTSVLANLCKIPGQALVIWENLRNQTEVRIELWHFFVKEVVPPSLDVKSVARSSTIFLFRRLSSLKSSIT